MFTSVDLVSQNNLCIVFLIEKRGSFANSVLFINNVIISRTVVSKTLFNSLVHISIKCVAI